MGDTSALDPLILWEKSTDIYESLIDQCSEGRVDFSPIYQYNNC